MNEEGGLWKVFRENTKTFLNVTFGMISDSVDQVYHVKHLNQGFLTGGKFPPWGKYWEFRGEMRAFENCCLFKTGDTKWFP